ncbi:hypothetical protein RJ40_06845 [Methanofollis aquaemaris]|uniref:Uncharacterized protein n=1 Tax=Methanofollis aquaemaris TaxID=126734 RepID=A0A8A3S4P1_9EURY|nr:hypothetical protein [Methanofollis aquaemaris]QSZ67237.1 hypothetical protein RJ40_06845 [Methanofollis aquaemaris]
MTAAAQITISEETLILLREMGCEGESDDQILKRLIEERAIASLDRRWNRILEGDEFFPVEEL